MATASQDAPEVDIDLYDPALVDDPWPALTRIRKAGPIVWNPRGYWMTARDRVCRRIFSQPDTLGQESLITSFFGEEAFITIDDRERHNALRNVWVASFGHRGVEKLVPLVRQMVSEMLDPAMEALWDGAEVDIFKAVCRPLPARVIAHMMGVSEEMTPTVIEWADAMASATVAGLPITPEEMAQNPYWLASERAKEELARFLLEQIVYRRKSPGNDLVSAIVHSEVAKRMSDSAMMVNLRQLMFAGNETTSNWLAHIVVTFGQFHIEWHRMRQERKIVGRAVEEVLRWQGVTQIMVRGVGEKGAVVAGRELPAGAEVVLLLGAAGRDPERYERPDVFDIDREQKPHLAFGFGLHSCLGAILARMEAREVTSALLDQIPNYRLSRSVSYANFSLRGPTSAWIKLSAA